MTAEARRLTQSEINAQQLCTDHVLEGMGGRAVHGGLIGIASQLLRVGLQLVSVYALARLLRPDDFGLYALAGVVTALISMLTELSVMTATVQRKQLDQDTVSALFIINMGLNLVAVLLAALAGPLVVTIFTDERLPMLVLVCTLAAPINALTAVHYALLQRHMRWYAMQFITLGCMVAGVAAGILAAWLFDAGYWALAVQAIASAIFGAVSSWALCPWRPTRVRNWSGAYESIRFGLQLMGSSAVWFLGRQSDNALIGWRWGVTELGFYSRAFNLLQAPLGVVYGPFAGALLPALSRLQDDPVRWRLAYLDALAVTTAFGGAVSCVLFGAADPFVNTLFGPGWALTADIFALLVIGMLASIPMSTTNWIYVSTGRSDRLLQWVTISTLFYLVAFILGLPHGAMGVAIAYGIAPNLAFIPCFLMANRGTHLTMGDIMMTVLPFAVVAAVLGFGLRLATGALEGIYDFIAAALVGVVYCAIVAALVWFWPPYARLRERALGMAQTLLQRMN
jgi:PST family polysaccharide transporter